MSGSWRLLAIVTVVAVLAACSRTTPGPGALFEPVDGQAQSGITLGTGEQGVLSPLNLRVAADGVITVDSVTPVEGNVNDTVAVDDAGLYRLDSTQDLLGVVRGAPSAAKAAELLVASRAPMTVHRGDELGFAIVVEGVSPGTWRADYVSVTYTLDGEQHEERVRYSLGVCVVEGSTTVACEPGLPSWW